MSNGKYDFNQFKDIFTSLIFRIGKDKILSRENRVGAYK